MHGYPKVINTRQDIDHLLAFLGSKWATQQNIDKALDYLQGLKDGTQYYEFDRVLGANEEPDGDYPDYLVLTGEEGDRRQLALVHNPSAKLYRLGLTLDDVDQLMATLESQ